VEIYSTTIAAFTIVGAIRDDVYLAKDAVHADRLVVEQTAESFGGGEPGQVLIVQEDGSKAWEYMSGVPVGQLCFSTTGTPLPGTVPVNVKQKFALDVYPQLEAWVRSCGDYLATEAEWDAEAAAQEGTCGRYCLTDTHIILPCYRHYFAAAQNGVAGKGVGDWLADAIRNILGTIDTFNSETTGATGVFDELKTAVVHLGETATRQSGISFDASRVVPTADENRPKTSYILPCIKAFDVAVNASQVDMQALAAQVSAINGNKVDRSEWTQSLGESGWQKLPSGLILQWGEVTSTAANQTIMLPVAMPNNLLQVFTTEATSPSDSWHSITDTYTNGSFRLMRSGSNGTVRWFAIGK
jgi:hypothetical protein